MQRLRGEGVPLWGALVLVLGAAPPSRAAERKEDEPPRSRQELVVTPTRQRSTVFETPRAASVVDREELRGRPPRTTAEALNDEEGVFVVRPLYAGGSPRIRGLGGQQVLLLVDGIRLNTTLTPAGDNHLLMLVDPYTLEGIEVIRGGSAVVAGADAMGGAVQLRSRAPVPLSGSDVELNAGLRGIFSSADLGGQGNLSAGGRWGRYAVQGSFSARRFGDVQGGSAAPAQPHTSYNDGAVSLGVGADLGRVGSLVAVYQGTRQYDALRTDLSLPGDLWNQAEVSRDLAYLRYQGRFEVGDRPLQAQATLYYQRQRELLDHLEPAQDRYSRDDNYVDVVGINGFAAGDAGRLGQVLGGIEGTFEWVTSNRLRGQVSEGPGAALTALAAQGRYPQGSSAHALMAFLQDEVDVERLLGLRPTRPGRLRLLTGVRLGGNFLSVGRDDRQNVAQEGRLEANLVRAGSAHLRFDPLEGLGLSAGFMSGFRAPNLADSARLGEDTRGFYLPAPALRPEISYSLEGGVRAAYRRAEGGAFYSYTWIDDALISRALSGDCGVGCRGVLLQRENAEQARFHAVEASGRVHLLTGLSLLATVSYVHGTVQRRDATVPEPYATVPPLNGVAALQLRRPRSTLAFAEVALRWAAPQDRLSPTDALGGAGTGGFAVLAVRAAARVSRFLYATAAVENLTNQSYRYHGSGVDGPGLGGVVSLEATY